MQTTELTRRGAVVVGVTGSGREAGILRFAAETARRHHAPVVLVHAYGVGHPAPPPGYLIDYEEAANVAHDIISDVEDEFLDLSGGSVECSSKAVLGPPSRVLVDLSQDARLVVVQHRATPLLDRLFVGSTVHGTAAHSTCPVVSVPTDWQPRSAPHHVVVGVHDDGSPAEAVEAGLDWAAATDATLQVVNAWRLDPAYEDILRAPMADEWHDEQVRTLEGRISSLRTAHPSVPVRVEVNHEWPAQMLVEASEVASLVVVGRHAGRWRVSPHLGSVVRTVLRHAEAPVMVVPLARAAGEAATSR